LVNSYAMQHGGETRAEEVESNDLRVGERYLKYVVARHQKRGLVIDETARDRVSTRSEGVGGWSRLANCAECLTDNRTAGSESGG